MIDRGSTVLLLIALLATFAGMWVKPAAAPPVTTPRLPAVPPVTLPAPKVATGVKLTVLTPAGPILPDAKGQYSVSVLVETTQDLEVNLKAAWIGDGERKATWGPGREDQLKIPEKKLQFQTIHLGDGSGAGHLGVLRIWNGTEEILRQRADLTVRPASITLLDPVPATFSPGVETLSLMVKSADSVSLSGVWTGVRGTLQEAKLSTTAVERGSIQPVTVELGGPVESDEKGYLRIKSCPPGGSEYKVCAYTDSSLTLTALRPTSGLWPFGVPLGLAVVAILLGIAALSLSCPIANPLALIKQPRKAIAKLWGMNAELRWNIGESFVANLNVGLTILGTVTTVGLSKYAPRDYATWSAFYLLATTLAPVLFGLLKKSDAVNKPVGSLPGFLVANLFNLFGVFGQLFFSRVLLASLPAAMLLDARAAAVLTWLPGFIGLCIYWYVWISFRSVIAPAPNPLGKAAAPRWNLL